MKDHNVPYHEVFISVEIGMLNSVKAQLCKYLKSVVLNCIKVLVLLY